MLLLICHAIILLLCCCYAAIMLLLILKVYYAAIMLLLLLAGLTVTPLTPNSPASPTTVTWSRPHSIVRRQLQLHYIHQHHHRYIEHQCWCCPLAEVVKRSRHRYSGQRATPPSGQRTCHRSTGHLELHLTTTAVSSACSYLVCELDDDDDDVIYMSIYINICIYIYIYIYI